jgi:cytochrome c oxidase subunit III
MPGSLTKDAVTGPPAPPPDLGGFGDGRPPGGWGASRRASFTGMVVLLAAITMMFAALTSAFVVRRGLSNDWVETPLPHVLFANTAILLLSSAVLEIARRRLRSGHRADFTRYWTGGSLLGILFLLGQGYAWRELKDAGIFVASNPSSSFFYLFTAAHGLHVLGGIVALVWVSVQAITLRLGPGKRTAVDVSALYWHFLDGLWVYLMLLFLVWG